MEKKLYYPEIDIVKGFAILMVICQHCLSSSLEIPKAIDAFRLYNV